jgi:hypothetical protein
MQSRLEASESSAVSLANQVAEANRKIVAGAGTLNLILEWDVLRPAPGTTKSESWKSVETGNRASITFVKSERPVLVMRSTVVVFEARERGITDATVTLSLGAPESFAQGTVADLSTSDYVQVQLPDIPPAIRIVSGELSVILNGDTRVSLRIPRQDLEKGQTRILPLEGNLAVIAP